jgi:hypothetical protein
MTTNVGEETAEPLAAVSSLDLDGSNPFWPKNMVDGPDTPATDMIAVDNVAFGADPADVTVNVHTIPAGQAWSVNFGDGSGSNPIAAGTNTATHHFIDKTPGKEYTITVMCVTDTDSKKVVY